MSIDDTERMGYAGFGMSSDLLQRVQLMETAGITYGGDRDIWDTLGYDRVVHPREWRQRWERGDIAETLVNLPAEMTWREQPDIIDDVGEGTDEEPTTQFEKDVQTLFDDYRLLHYLERWDKAIGLGEYGLLLIGLAESEEVDPTRDGDEAPALADSAEEGAYSMDDLAYFSIFTQQSVDDIEVVENPLHERFGLPLYYDLEIDAGTTERSERVHYTRVIHAAEGLLDNEIYVKPRLRAVLNRLDDRDKILGGAAEAYWRSADRRLHLDYNGDAQPQDADEVAAEAEEMIHGLRGVLTTQNTDLNTIDGSDPDPSAANDAIMEAIAGTRGIPKRILTGSERGELASTQDKATLAGRIQERRQQFGFPMMLRELIERLITLGIVTPPSGGGYTIEGGDLFELNDLELAELQEKRANTIKAAGSPNAGAVATTEEIRENIMEWDPELGSETTADVQPELEERENEPDPGDDTPEDTDEMEDILEDIVSGPGENGDGEESAVPPE